jgi:VWFA-related protein
VVVLFRAVDRDLVPVTGIRQEELRLLDNGNAVPIRHFESGVGFSKVVVLADVSGSMGPVIEALQGGLYTFADMLSRDAERQSGDILFSLIPFSEQVTPLVDRSTNAYEFKDAVSRLHTMGGTSLVDAVIATLRLAFGDKPVADDTATATQSPGPPRSRFLVVYTDAGENSSRHDWSEILAALAGTDVVIYSIALDSGTRDSNFANLAEISRRSGGRLFRAQASELEKVYRQVAADIRSHYLASFEAASTDDPTRWRTIALTTSRPGVAIFARKGYCPVEDRPCQLPDGTFAEARPVTFDGFVEANRNPALVATLKERLRAVRLGVSPATARITRELMDDTLFVERLPRGTANRSGFKERWLSESSEQTDIDAEVCAFRIADDLDVSGTNVVKEEMPDTGGRQQLVVMSPDFRIAEGARIPRRSPAADTPGERQYQSELQFRLKDPTRTLPTEIRVLCRRPKFLINEDLVDLAVQAAEYALQLTAQGARR